MEIRSLQTDSAKAPMVGESVYAVLEEANHQVNLLHLATLTEFSIAAIEYNGQVGTMYWPENRSGLTFIPEKMTAFMRRRFVDLARRKIAFPVSKTLAVIAALEGKDLAKVMAELQALAPTEGNQSEQQLKFSKKYRVPPLFDIEGYAGRERAILQALMELGEASFYQVVEKVIHENKTKKDPAKEKERMVTFFLNKFCDRGVLEFRDNSAQEWSKIQVSEEDSMAEKKASKKSKAPKVGRENWLYRLAASVKVDKLRGQALIVANAVQKLGKATSADITKEAKANGLKAKAELENCTKYHLHRLNLDKYVVIEKPAVEEAA